MSIISRIYGIYEVKLPGVDPVNLILQRNCMKIQPFNKMLQIFDLKGSTFKREALNKKNPESTLKDTDFIKLNKKNHVNINISEL